MVWPMHVQTATYAPVYRRPTVSSQDERPAAGLEGREVVRAGLLGSVAYTAGSVYPTVWVHEMAHAVTASALYQNANPTVTVTPLQGGVTRWTPGPLTELGQQLGPEYARASVAAAGSLIDIGIATSSFAAGYLMRKKHPVAGAALMGYAAMSSLNTVMYAASALGATQAGNDFATIASMTGIHPLVTLGVVAAILPAEYLLLRHLEKKGIIGA